MADEQQVNPGAAQARSALEQSQVALGSLGLRHRVVMSLFRLATEWLEEEQLLLRALEVLQDSIGAEAGSVLMVDRAVGDLYFAAATGPVAGDLKAFRMDRNEGIAGWAMESRQAIRVSNVASEPRWHREVSDSLGFDVRQLLAAPIIVGSRVIGCVELINKTGPGGDDFVPEDGEVLIEAAECIGILFGVRGGRGAQ